MPQKTNVQDLLKLGRSRAALVCDGPTERNNYIRAPMAFESLISSYAHGLRGAFDRVSPNPTSQRFQPPPRGCMGPKACETPTFVWRSVDTCRHMRTAKEAAENETKRTVHVIGLFPDRQAAARRARRKVCRPAGVLIAPLYRSDFEKG